MCLHIYMYVCVYRYDTSSYKQDDIACAKAAVRSYKSGIVPLIHSFSLSLAMMTERIMISLK